MVDPDPFIFKFAWFAGKNGQKVGAPVWVNLDPPVGSTS